MNITMYIMYALSLQGQSTLHTVWTLSGFESPMVMIIYNFNYMDEQKWNN